MASFSNSKIPEDLLIDILARLPVKSLLRFKCVNKYWNSLIESPNFISTHHDRNPTMLLVLRYVSHRDVLRDPNPNCPSDRFICEFFGYDIVSDDESYVVTTSNRFAPVADITSSDDECNTGTTSSEGGINLNAVETGYPNSSTCYWNPREEAEDEAMHKEFALAMFRDDDINKLSEEPQSEPPPYEDIIDITDIGGLVNHLQTITGPVNGLFLLHNGCGTLRACYNRLALWNPATTELRLLPSPDFNVFFPNPDCVYVFGFGLDPLTNNYKVVWIPVRGSTNPEAEPPNVAVYSLETNSWRHFNAVLPSVAKMFHSESTYLNGSYYWLSQHMTWEHMKERIKVVLFDMGNDVFREIQISDGFTRNLELGVQDVRIMVHNGDSIALLVSEYIRGIPDFVLDSIDIWVMKQEHEGCWTKLFTLGLGPHLQLEKPLGFWKNNNQIFFTTSSNSEFVLYNVDTSEISHIGVQCDLHPAIYNYSPSIFNYKESLVSFGGQKKCCKRGKLHAMVQDFFAFQPTPP